MAVHIGTYFLHICFKPTTLIITINHSIIPNAGQGIIIAAGVTVKTARPMLTVNYFLAVVPALLQPKMHPFSVVAQ
ncbi:MAG: hypothetical protein ACR5K4_04275 [Sodalis sp. (in: enterobacteria)]